MKNSWWKILAVSISALFLTFMLTGCSPVNDVKYRVICDGDTLDITYKDEFEDRQTIEEADSPWSIRLSGETGSNLYISGTRTGLPKIHYVTVEIYVDGILVAESTDYQNAHTSYTIP